MRWLLNIPWLLFQVLIHGLRSIRKHFGVAGTPSHPETERTEQKRNRKIDIAHTRILQVGRLAAITICLLLFFCRPAQADPDLTGFEIETNGWVCKVWVSELSSNSMFFNGMLTNNVTSHTNGLRLTLVSMGFDGEGNATTVGRTIYGTKLLRLVTPSNTTNDIQTNAGVGSVFRVALSDWVYDLDSNITARVWFQAFQDTNSGVFCLGGSGFTVTNSSIIPYPKVIANWTWPGWNRETNSSIRLRAVGFHTSARQGRPLVAMKFIGTDESGDAVTNVQSEMVIDRTLPDIFPTGEYVGDIAQAAFTQGDRIRCDFIAYPWMGDANSVMDTTLNTYVAPRPTSITNLCDKTNGWSQWIAVIGSAGAAPRVTNVHPSLVNSAHYFGSWAAGNDQLAASNWLSHGHATSGGSYLYAQNGIVNFSGATVGSNLVPRCWTTLRPFPGHAVSLTNDTGTDDLNDRVKIDGSFEGGTIRLAFPGTTIPFSSCQKLWLNQCTIDSPGLGPFQANEMWATHCNITNLVQGLRASSILNNEWFNVRGCNLDGFNHTLLVQMTIGNKHPNTNGPDYRVVFDLVGQGTGHDFQICYNNFFGGMTVGGGSEGLDAGTRAFVVSNGFALVQNVIERTGAAASPAAQIASIGSLASTNILIWHNLILGERIADMGSSGSETALVWRDQWSSKNNVFDLTGFKKDYDTPTDADRIGNWTVMNQVNGKGNIFVECRVNVAAGTFAPEFNGLDGIRPFGQGTNTINYPRFTDRKAYDGGGAVTAGGGNYRLLSDAPGWGLVSDWLIRFDMEGLHRGRIDSPGAYASGNARKGAFF